MGVGEEKGNVGEEMVRRGQHHPYSIFQGLSKLQGRGVGEVVLVSEEGGHVACHALLLAAASPLLCNLLPQTPDQDEVLILVPAKHQAIRNLVNHLYGHRDVGPKDETVDTDELVALLGINQELSKAQSFDGAAIGKNKTEQKMNDRSNQNAPEEEECVSSGSGSSPNGKKPKQHETKCGTEHRCGAFSLKK